MSPVLPGGTIGILGDGQLGRMLAIQARRMGYRVLAMGPHAQGPAAQVVDGFIEAPLGDVACAIELARRADVVTLETEHVSADLLEKVEQITPLRPSSATLRTIQDRLTQKDFLARHGLPHAAYAPVGNSQELAAAADRIGFPSILKTRRSGYDGKGQVRVSHAGALAGAWEQLRREPAIFEAVIPFVKEISVIVARDVRGNVDSYGAVENVHRNHVLHTTIAPARLPAAIAAQAVELSRYLVEALNHVGVMGVEMFLDGDGKLLINEVAPRTHNTGHYTLGACVTSQFEQHIRAICGLALGDPSLMRQAAMVNLLGDLWSAGQPCWDRVLMHRDAQLHLYGKSDPRPGRKMGHILVLGDSSELALATAEDLWQGLEGDDAPTTGQGATSGG